MSAPSFSPPSVPVNDPSVQRDPAFKVPFFRILAAAALLVSTGALTMAGGPYTAPVGTLTVATVEAPLLQSRVGYPYTLSSYAYTPANGNKNPHGSVGVARAYQNRLPGNVYSPATPISMAINSKDWPSNSGLEKTRTYGPFTPGDTPSVPEGYGMETVTLVYDDGNGNESILDTKQIFIYPATANAQIYNALAPPLTALSASYSGDPPRAMVQMANVYPGAQSWVVIYPGTFQGTSAPSSPKVANTLYTAPLGDISSAQTYVELGSLATTSGQSYTVQAFQQTTAYGLEPFYVSATNHAAFYDTFSVNLHFNVNGEVGTSK